MKKVIVFQVENVLVKGYDEEKMDEMRGRKMVREIVGNELFWKEFMKEMRGGKKVMMGCGEIIERIRELEKRHEEEGDEEKRYWMRDVRRKLEEWEREKIKRREEMRRKNMEYSFEKKVIGRREELKDLERICEIVGGRIIFVSGMRKGRVERLLYNNGLRVFSVVKDLSFIEEERMENVAVIDSVEKLRDMWGMIGLRRA